MYTRWEDLSNSQRRVGHDIARWPRKAGIPYMGRASGLPRTCKDLFTHITQALNIDDTDPEERKATQAIIPDFVVDLHALPEWNQKGITTPAHPAHPSKPKESRQGWA